MDNEFWVIKSKAESDPIPIPNRGGYTGITEHLLKVEIGGSFKCELSARNKVLNIARVKGIKFKTRKTGQNELTCWRTA